jgi:hypothetical protein
VLEDRVRKRQQDMANPIYTPAGLVEENVLVWFFNVFEN